MAFGISTFLMANGYEGLGSSEEKDGDEQEDRKIRLQRKEGKEKVDGERRKRKEEENSQETAQLTPSAEFILALNLAKFCPPKEPLGRPTLAPQEPTIRPTPFSLISS